jgi:uncharacterized protein DUF6916
MDLTEKAFKERQGDTFTLDGPVAGTTTELRLDEVTTLGPDGFTLLFRGALPGWLPQRIYRLRHAALGELDIFLVPIGPDPQGFRYEAVFNRATR